MRSQAATNLALSKKLIAEMTNTRKLPTTTTCADETNCYNKVSHPCASLCSQRVGLGICDSLVLFKYEDAPPYSV